MKNTCFLIVSLIFCVGNHSIAQSFYSRWAKRMGGASAEFGKSVAVDAAGNVLTAGYFSGTADFDPGAATYNLTATGGIDIFVSKLDAAGNFLWAKRIGGGNDDYGLSVAVDLLGNVYTTGEFQVSADFDPGNGTFNLISAGSIDAFVLKLDASGNFVWAKRLGGTMNERGLSIAVDGNQQVYTTGWFAGMADFDPGAGTFNLNTSGNDNIYVSKLDTAGNFLWAKQLGGTQHSHGYAIVVDKNGNAYTTGYFSGTADFDPDPSVFNLSAAGIEDIFVSKLDPSGKFLWAIQQSGTSSEIATSITLDASGSVYTTGHFEGSVDFDPGNGTFNMTANGISDVYVSKLDAVGNLLWAKQWGGAGLDIGYAIKTDVAGNVYTTGYFKNTVDFDPGPAVFNLSAFGLEDIFITKLSASGDYIWTKQIGSSGNDYGYSLAIDAAKNIYVGGAFQGTADFAPGSDVINLSAVGSNDIFVARYDQVTLEVQPGNSLEQLVKEVLVGSNCYDINNISYSGNDAQIGQFSNGATNIGFDSGIILATGDINLAPGPNDRNDAGGGGLPGVDSDLSSFATGNLYDVATIEFDVTPTKTSLILEYVFASEEYCEYVNTAFSDVVGIFISGPGISGVQNLAVVPNTGTPISINTINHFTNASFYVHNTPAGLENCETGGTSGTLPPAPPATGPATQEFQYDGFTRKMTAAAQVIPCSTYHIKLAVADVGDGSWDSAVFLKAGSFDGGGNATVDWVVNGDPDLNEVVEGCGAVELVVSRAGPEIALPQVVLLSITGMASSGTDFEPIPTVVVFPSGVEEVTIPFNILDDLIPEGAETVILNLNYQCSCLDSNQTLTILDYQPMLLTGDTVEICGQSVGTVGVFVEGGVEPYTYNWNTGATDPEITAFVGVSTNFTVTVTDACGNTKTTSSRIVILPQPSAQITPATLQLCPGQNGSIPVNLNGVAPFELVYSINGTLQPPITGISSSPYMLVVNQAGAYQIASVTDARGCSGAGVGTATVALSNLALTGTASNTSCATLNNGAINTTVSGGQAPYGYVWQGPSAIGNIADPTNLAAGMYQVTVTDGFGCTKSQSFVISAPPPLTVSATVACDDVTINASGGTGVLLYSVNGINFQIGNQFLNLSNGTYTLAVRDANGCTATTQVSISNNLTLTTLLAQPRCFGSNDGKITANSGGGTAPLTFSLNGAPGQSSGVFNNLTAGNYTVTVKDNNGCSVSSNSLVLNNPPQLQLMATATQNTITAQASGGTGAYSFSRNGIDFQTANQFPNVPNGTYTITVKDANGCTATTTVNVNILSATAQATTILCFGGVASLTIDAVGGTPPYLYKLGTGNYQASNVFSNVHAGAYTIRVLDGAGTIFTLMGTINEPPVLNTSVNVVCNDASLSISGGTPPYTSNPTQSALMNLPNGNYQVIVTDNNGCTLGKTFSVNVMPLDFTSETDSVKCFGGNTGSITANGLGGCPPYTYSLNGSPLLSNNTFSNLAFGTYSVTVRDSKNNERFKTVTVHQPVLLTLSAVVNGNSIAASAAGGVLPYSFRLNGGPAQGSAVFTNLSNGNYTVMVTDGNGCSASVPNLMVAVGTIEPAYVWGAVVSPNPGTGLFNLTLQNAPEHISARVFDMSGRQLKTFNLQTTNGTLATTIDLVGLPNGTYLLLLSAGDKWGSLYLSKTGG